MRFGFALGLVGSALALANGGCETTQSTSGREPTLAPSGGSGADEEEPERECQFDFDEDGYCDDASVADGQRDCNDRDSSQFPGAVEVLNAVDDDCDGTIDDGLTAACALTLDEPEGGCETPEQLVVGSGHACVLVDSGRVLCWGKNLDGVLGSPDIVNAAVPIAVPGVEGATALVSASFATCALLRDSAICWGAGSAFPFTVPLPANTMQIALGEGLPRALYALDASGQSWVRPLFFSEAPTFDFVKYEAGVARLVGGAAACVITIRSVLRCGGEDVAAQVELAAMGVDGSLCYKSASELYCNAKAAPGGLIAGNGSAIGVGVAPSGSPCAFNDTGKLACLGDGPKKVTDAAQVALGRDFGCVLRQSGAVSCWGSTDGGTLGNGKVKPGTTMEPVDVRPGPTLSLPPVVLLGAAPLGACDTAQDLAIVVHPDVNVHATLTVCKQQCENRLDTAECFNACAMPTALTSACFACYAELATCQGPDCYAAFQTCAGYPVDFAPALRNQPRFQCPGASCFRGKTVGQACSEGDSCFTGHCDSVPQAPDSLVCVAADGATCYENSQYCACDLGQDSGFGACGGCYAEGRTGSARGDCYRDCTTESYCTTGQTCRSFSDGREKYCDSR